jgi:hypothetical protein
MRADPVSRRLVFQSTREGVARSATFVSAHETDLLLVIGVYDRASRSTHTRRPPDPRAHGAIDPAVVWVS